MQVLFCPTPGIKDRTFCSSGLSAKRALMSASAIPHSAKNAERTRGGKRDVEYTGKVVNYGMIALLAAGETCKAIF